MKRIWLLFLLVFLAAIPARAQDASAQTANNNIEALGTIPASQMLSGLGVNIDPDQSWEFVLAKASGITHVRFQCSWVQEEIQSAPPSNTSTGFSLDSKCAQGIASSKTYGMKPTIVAAFGAPYHQILTVTVPGGAAIGATSITVQFSSGVNGTTISALAPFYNTILLSNGNQISNKNSYAGDLVTNVTAVDSTHATLTLASALNVSLLASTPLMINQYLYPPAATSSPSNASVLKFANYAKFLAQSIAAANIAGEVELWNEPTWAPDPWDAVQNFYDTFPGAATPGPQSFSLPNWGIAAAMSSSSYTVTGVTYVWAGPNKSGDNSVLDPHMLANAGVSFTQPAVNVLTESLHPYGNNPEDSVWSESCLQDSIADPYSPSSPQYFANCLLDSNSSSNALKVEQENLIAKASNASYGIAHSITETGFALTDGDQAHQARFTMRQFLAYQAIGVTPVEFYRMYDTSPDDLTLTDLSTKAALPALTALSGLISDLNVIKNAPVVDPTDDNTPSIVTYGGAFPLDTVSIVGSRTGDTINSEVYVIWQRSHVTGSSTWATLAQPTAASATVAIPTGARLVSATNLDTRTPVSFTTSGQNATLSVSDDPVELLIEPAPVVATIVSIAIVPPTSTLKLGGTVVLGCVATMSDATTQPCPPFTLTSSNPAVASISGTIVTGVSLGTATISVALQ